MNIALWILQTLLAFMFFMTGFMKVSKSKKEILETAGERMTWVDSLSAKNLQLIGVLELLAAFGLILPALTGILPWLTPLAAVGLVLIMVGAAALHAKRGDDPQQIVMNTILLLVAAFVAYGRFALAPF